MLDLASTWFEKVTNMLSSLYVVGYVVVEVKNIQTTGNHYILLRNLVNPNTQQMTSFFSVCLEVQGVPIECDYTFARVLLSPALVTTAATASLITDPQELVVGQAATYLFKLSVNPLGSWYSSNQQMSIRIILPQPFISRNPQCSLAFHPAAQDTTFSPVSTVSLAGHTGWIECRGITEFSKFIYSGSLEVKIETVESPLWAKDWFDARVEILRSIHNEVIQVLSLSVPITTVVEQMTGSVKQTNRFRNSTTYYEFCFNHDAQLGENSAIQIKVGNVSQWKIYSGALISGFSSPSTVQQSISDTLFGSTIHFDHYGVASKKNQQCIAINLTSPVDVGPQAAQIHAFVENREVGIWKGVVIINQTYGQCSLLSLSAVRQKIKLPANATGPLELTFFLNHQLPASEGLKNGSLQLSVYPQLTAPDPAKNGVLKCYFKGTYQASQCKIDNSDPARTQILVVSPPLQDYQYSEVPIIITTEGAIDEQSIGFPIDPLVTRYRFQSQFFLYNSSSIPSEVFYSEWIADAKPISGVIASSLSHQCNQWTSLTVNFNLPPLAPIATQRQLRLMVQFLEPDGAWHPQLGYQQDQIYKEYPCLITGLPGTRVKCDLYTYTAKKRPYNALHINSKSLGPFFILYGFDNPVPANSFVTIHFPKIQIGSTVNIDARIKLCVLEETPAQLQPYVELYSQNVTVFTTLPAISMAYTAISTTQTMGMIAVQNTLQYSLTWSPVSPSLAQFFKYQLYEPQFPSLSTTNIACVTSSCYSAGYPANWIVQQPPLPVLSTHSIQTLLSFIATVPYVSSRQEKIGLKLNSYDGIGNTLQKSIFSLDYVPQTLTGYFQFIQPVLYAGLEQWYSISFAVPAVSVSNYPFLRLILDSNLEFSVPLQCNSSTVLPFNQSGLQFQGQSSQSLVLFNLKKIMGIGTYQLNCRLRTTSNVAIGPINPQIDIELHHNFTIGDSFVAIDTGVVLKQAPVTYYLGRPIKFQVSNPQMINQQPRLNYVGPLFLIFNSNFAPNYVTNYSLNLFVTLKNHRYNGAGWTSPTTNVNDPLVCFLNGKRTDCSWTHNPLTFKLTKPAIINGINQLQFTSEYVAPANGVKFPGCSGNYWVGLQLQQTNSTIGMTTSNQHSFFVQILGHDLQHFEASSIVKDIDTESVYIVNFTIPAWRTIPTANNDATNFSRIFIEFPTKIDGLTIFKSNLGGYKGELNQKVGCSFLTGLTYVLPLAGKALQCRFIPPQSSNDKVKIEVINHAAFTATRNNLAVFIYKVFNPALAYRSFDITVNIVHTQVATGNQFELYSASYTIFLDANINNSAPVVYPSADNQTTIDFFDPALDVGDYGAITLKAQAVSGLPLIDPYYVLYKLPSYLSPENGQLALAFKLCSTALFQLCLTAPQVGYVLTKAKVNPATFQVFIKNYPISISQEDSLFEGLVIQQGRLTGKLLYNITSSFRWAALQGKMIFNSLQAVGSTIKLAQNKQYCEVVISFTTKNYIPASGSIEIVFPASVSGIQPNCRSATGLGSSLLAQAGSSGEIGCQIQNSNSWVLTGFQALAGGLTVKIRGYIGLPSLTGTIGAGQIISYADYHPTDIHKNGSRIDYINTDFGLLVGTSLAMNANQDIFLSQRGVIRAGYVGQFRLIFKNDLIFKTTDYLELSFARKDIKGNPGGFAVTTTRPKVCEFIRIDTEQRIGCYVTLQAETFIFRHEAAMYKIATVQDLQIGVQYELRLTSQDYVQPEGIQYPTVPSTYKLDALFNHSGTIRFQQRYIDVYGNPFSMLSLTQYNYMAGAYSPFWLQITPAVTIPSNHQIILEFPTLSNDNSTRMYSDDLGFSALQDGDSVPVDLYNYAVPFINSFLNCRLYKGDYLRAFPARIICGAFTGSILAGQTIKIAFAITNPLPMTVGVLSQISLPLFIYHYDPYLFQKVQYDTVDVASYVNNANQFSAPNGYFSTASNQLQFPNDKLSFANNNARPLLAGDSYVVRFNFPLRVNNKVLSACTNQAGTIIYGDAFYHQNLRTVVCKLTAGVPANAIPSLATFRLSGFYTPWYALTLQQRKVWAIATYHSSTDSEFISYFDFFPLLGPRWSSFAAGSLLQATGILPHSVACQWNDYLIKVQLQNAISSVNFNLQYTKIVMVQLPLSIVADYDFHTTDCQEHPTSSIQIQSCRVDSGTRSILITLIPGIYHNAQAIVVQTRGLAIRNPCVLWSTASIYQWEVYFLSFENGTLPGPNPVNAYLLIKSPNNMLGFTLSFSPQTAANISNIYYTFDWFQIPQERFFEQFLQYDSGQYSPFTFQILFTSAIPAPSVGTTHKLKLTFGVDYLPCGIPTLSDDLAILLPVCYLMNNRINQCYVNTTDNTTWMLFDFGLPANTRIYVQFSVLDPRNPQFDGYEYIGTEDVSQLQLSLLAQGTTYTFLTPPFEAQQTQVGPIALLPVRGITLGTIDYANCVATATTMLDIKLTVSRTDITALKFEIPMIDEAGFLVFGSTYKSAFFNLQNGDEFPCGNNQAGITYTGRHKCYLYYGQFDVIGSPIQIIMTDFNQGTTINVRLLYTNPSTPGGWISLYVKAYTGLQNQFSLYGNDYVGFWNFPNVYQVCSGSYWPSNNFGSYLTPNFGLWRQNTQWNLVNQMPSWPYPSIPINSYVFIEVLLYQLSTSDSDDQICKPNFALGQSLSDDMIMLKSREGGWQKAYFIRKWTGSWTIRYLKCKHYNTPFIIHYSTAKTTMQKITNYFSMGWPYTGSSSSGTLTNVAATNNHSLIQMDLTPQINLIFSEGFIWDEAVNYQLQILLYINIGNYPFNGINKCRVVEGFGSSILDLPICSADWWGTTITVSKFTEMLKNARVFSYRIKIELQHTGTNNNGYYTTWGWNRYYSTVKLFAGTPAASSGWYVFQMSTGYLYETYRYFDWINSSPTNACQISQDPSIYPIYQSPYKATTNQLNVNIINLSTNMAATLLQLHVTVSPKVIINMNLGYTYSYPQFRFQITNYQFTCASTSFTKFILTYHQGATTISYDYFSRFAMLSCPTNGQISIFFFYNSTSATFGNIWGPQSTTFDLAEWFEFDIEIAITGATQPMVYRDWVSLTTYIDIYQYTQIICWDWWWGNRISYKTYYTTVAISEDHWLPLNLLAGLSLQPLTTNVGQPTEMMISLATANLAFGAAEGKLLVLQFNNNLNPFTYINTTTRLSKLQCKCISDWNPGVVLEPQCLFRPNSVTGMPSAITVNMEVGYLLSAKCYFPEWMITTGSITLTARLTNDKGGSPTPYTNFAVHGGFWKTVSPTYSFAGSPALANAALTQTSNPALYSPTTYVNTNLADYTLKIALGGATSQPIVYIDFQKAGIIPNAQFCTNTFFLQCRAYSTLRHILVAQYKISPGGPSSLVLDSNFAFFTYLPKHQESGADSQYHLIARVLSAGTDTTYSYKGTLTRAKANLLPTNVSILIQPERTTGYLTATRKTNIILSFELGGQFFYSYVTNSKAAIEITCSDPSVLSTLRGCTALAVADPFFEFFCEVRSSTLTLRNKYTNVYFNRTGLIQIILGIINPSSTITFNLKGYEYYVGATNYGLSLVGSGTYTPVVIPGLMPTNQMSMYRFNTRIYSDTFAPFRVRFKLSTVPLLPSWLTDGAGYKLLFADLDMLTPYTYFECMFRQFSLQPIVKPQTAFPNSFRNLKQRTQHKQLYVNCWTSVLNKTALFVNVPLGVGLLADRFYELVIMPVGTSSTSGFAIAADTWFKLISMPNSCEHINKIQVYSAAKFSLNGIQLLTRRPAVPTALRIDFDMHFSSGLTYPSHHFQIVFRDLDMSAIQFPYNTQGLQVPCTLSALFIVAAGRKLLPQCIVQQVDTYIGTLIIRVTEIGPIAAGNYLVSFDDFILPSMVAPYQQTSPFTACLHFYTLTLHYERCFGQLFMIDLFTNKVTQSEMTPTPIVSNKTYGATNVVVDLPINQYPLVSTGLMRQKIGLRIQAGYAATSVAPLSLMGYTPLWYNTMTGLYIYQQTAVAGNSSYTFSLRNLINPQPYQQASYTSTPNVELILYDNNHPITRYTYNMPIFTSFLPTDPLIYASSVLYFDDVKQNIPIESSLLYKLELTILDSSADISTKQLQKVEIAFDAGVELIQRCWVETKTLNLAFQFDGGCQNTANKIILYGLRRCNNNNNLTIYVQMRLASQTVNYNSTVYVNNTLIQYYSTGQQTFTALDSSISVPNFLDFTENIYTPYYYEQKIEQIRIGALANRLYFSLFLPADLTHALTVFKITLPTTITPSIIGETRLVCQWLISDAYGRRYLTGEHSICSWANPNILVQAPFGGMLRLSPSNQPIPYLLKIREFALSTTAFKMPLTAKNEQIILTHLNSVVAKQDTLIIYPKANFASGKLKVLPSTLSIDHFNTYHVEFTPSATVTTGTEAILQLSFDSRYMPSELGIQTIYSNYGMESDNISRIENSNFNVLYPCLPQQWINGIPYSGHTSTFAQPQQTSIHAANSHLRAVLLLQTSFVAGTTYHWRIPLLSNPTTPDKTIRMNLTLLTFQAGSYRPQRQLFSQIINLHRTVSVSTSPLNYTLSPQAQLNTVQSNTASLSIDVSFPYTPDTDSLVEMKISRRGVGIIGLTDFDSRLFPDTSFDFYYFGRLHLLLASKKINDTSRSISLGALEKANFFSDDFGYDWVKVHSNSQLVTIWNAGSLHQNLLPCILTPTASTLLEGNNIFAGSEFLLQISLITVCLVSVNSTVAIYFEGSMYDWTKEASCLTSFRSMGCIYSSGMLLVRSLQLIPASTTITVSIYLKILQPGISTTPSVSIYGLPNNNNTVIGIAQSVAILPATNIALMDSGDNEHIVVQPLYENTRMKIRGTIEPRTLPLNFFQILHPFSWSSLSHRRLLFRQNISSLLDQTQTLNWINSNFTAATTFETFKAPPNGIYNYQLAPNEYSFLMESTYDTAGLNNLSIGAVGKFYQFIYTTDSQIAYEEVYPSPVPVALTIINPLKTVNEITALGFKFTISFQPIVPGNIISISLDSHNLLKSMYQFNSEPIECIEGVQGILTTAASLVCNVYQYPTSSKPLIIHIFPKLPVVANIPLQIWISPILNPAAIMVAGATLKLEIDCLGQQRCVTYEARGYYKTASDTIIDYNSTIATFTPSNTEVLKKAVGHTFTFNAQLASAIFLKYPENYEGIMSNSCTQASGKCLIFPKQKVALALLPSTSLSSLLLNNMNNGFHVCPITEFIKLRVASSGLLERYDVNHTNLTTIKTNYLRNKATAITITATQSPNVFLRNYYNTAAIQLFGLYTDPYIKAFYLHAPSDVVSWDVDYCNATLTSVFNNPYPTRLTCLSINDTTIAIGVPEGVSYQYNITDDYVVTINCKFKLKDFAAGQNTLYVSPPVMSGNFNAYGSYSPAGDDYHYYVTEAAQPILISQYQVPLIGNIEFTSEGYAQRFANINDLVSFDLLYDPATPEPIAFIELRLPEMFGYPAVGNHDACSLLARTTVGLPTCQQIRKDNQTFLRIIPPADYTNGPVLIRIANQDPNLWFRAPALPGSWYNYTLSAYSSTGVLLQRQQSENCSTIGGLELHIPNMSIANGKDALMEEIVDVTFTVGKLPLQQGYVDGLFNGQYYTNIHIIFQNWQAYQNLLMPKNSNQTLIGCVTQGLQTKREIECLLVGGGDIQHEPTVVISGYDWVAPYTKITISLPNIVMLDVGTRNVLSVGVALKKVGSWKQAYLYNPEQLLLTATSNMATTLCNFLDLGYLTATTVGSSTTFFITVQPSVDIDTYFVVKLPIDFLANQPGLYSPGCAQANRIQLFLRSDLIRIYPQGGLHTRNVRITYIITDFPSTEYSMSLIMNKVTFEAYKSWKQVHHFDFPLSFQSTPCSLVFSLLQYTSPYAYDQNIIYTFEIGLSTVPLQYQDNLTLAVVFPQDYLANWNDAGCRIDLPMTCQMLSNGVIQIRNARSSVLTRFLLNVTGLINPGNLAQIFTIYSYNGDRLEQVQCKSITSLLLRNSTIMNCGLTALVNHITSNQQAAYKFSLLCPETIKNNSHIKLQLPNDYMLSNPIGKYRCWSDAPLNMLTKTCSLLYQNATLILLFPNITIGLNQISLLLNAILFNPPFSKQYSYRATFNNRATLYAITNNPQLSFMFSSVAALTNLEMTAIPTAAGAQCIYILRMPAKMLSNSMEITFPEHYQLEKQVQASAYFTSDGQWARNQPYFDTLQTAYHTEIGSAIALSSRKAILSVSGFPTIRNGSWLYLILRPILNPAYTDPSSGFMIRNVAQGNQLLSSGNLMGPRVSSAADGIHFVAFTTNDDDLRTLTVHNLTYRLDEPLFTDQTSLIIVPSQPDWLYAVPKLNCCLYVDSVQIECHTCRVGMREIQFKILKQGLLILPDQTIMLSMDKLFTPGLRNDCRSLLDYVRSYYHLLIFRNGSTLTHQSIYPSADNFTPCLKFRPVRGDILFTAPSILYAGMAYSLPLAISRPSKMVRIRLSSPNYDLSFDPLLSYFANYELGQKSVQLLVDPGAQPAFTFLNMSHEQSIVYNLYRDNLPLRVQIRNDHIQYVQILQSEAFSIGEWLEIPISLTVAASYDLFIETPSMPAYCQFDPPLLKIPSMTKNTSLRFRYTSDIAPPTLTVPLKLRSSSILRHTLRPEQVYFYFSVTPQFQTLPNVLKLQVLHQYKQNGQFAGKKVYLQGNYLFYDQLKPAIIQNITHSITATTAKIFLFTRHEAQLHYLLLQRGDTPPSNPAAIRKHQRAGHTTTLRNSSQYVNAYRIVNLSKLEHQTMYELYAMASDSMGDSLQFIVHRFTTNALPGAVELRLDTSKLITDTVYLVHCISDILDVDILRVKIVDSYRIRNQTWGKYGSSQNQLNYRNRFVISPSLYQDTPSPYDLVTDQLINQPSKRLRLAELMPQFIDNFAERIASKQPEELPLIHLSPHRPLLKIIPQTTSISYYSATFSMQLWSRGIIFAVAIEQFAAESATLQPIESTNGSKITTLAQSIPYSKQIIRGKNSHNGQADCSVQTATDAEGKALLQLSVLKADTAYSLYVSATNWQPYEPILYAQNKDIIQVDFRTLPNPNLHQNSPAYMLSELKTVDPELYDIIMDHRQREKTRNSLKN